MRSAERWESVEGYFVCGSFGRFFLYRRESERTLPGGRDRASAGHIRSAYFIFLATDFTGGLGKPDFLFYRPV